MEQTSTDSRRRKPTDVRTAEIVGAATRILAAGGPRKLTARALATAVGITPAAIYRHFDGMDGVLDAVVERVEEILFEGFPPEGGDPIDRLGIFFAQRIRAIVANPDVSPVLLSGHVAEAAGTERAARIRSFRSRSRDFVKRCLREAEAQGLLAEGLNPEAASVLVLGAILALAHGGLSKQGRGKDEKLSCEVWALLEGRILKADRRGPGATRCADRLETNGGWEDDSGQGLGEGRGHAGG